MKRRHGKAVKKRTSDRRALDLDELWAAIYRMETEVLKAMSLVSRAKKRKRSK